MTNGSEIIESNRKYRSMRTLLFISAFFFVASLSAQRTVDLRLVETGINLNSQRVKAEIQVRKTDRAELILGGYNMRLYYNSQKLDLIENKVQSLLSGTKYGKINIDNHLRDVNVTGYGKIPYTDSACLSVKDHSVILLCGFAFQKTDRN